MPDTFDTLRPYLFDYLRAKGIDPRRRFRCLNPDHLDRNPSMAYDARRHRSTVLPAGRTMTSSTSLSSTIPIPRRSKRWLRRAACTVTAM